MNLPHAAHSHARKVAAEDLADRLKALADHLGTVLRPMRISYGGRRVGDRVQLVKPRSPEGFVVKRGSLQLLLPDGRLWSYSRSDAARFPQGRFYDPRHDHVNYGAARAFPSGTQFSFLGAVLGDYSFGIAQLDESDSPTGLCALLNEGSSVRLTSADAAFEQISAWLIAQDGALD